MGLVYPSLRPMLQQLGYRGLSIEMVNVTQTNPHLDAGTPPPISARPSFLDEPKQWGNADAMQVRESGHHVPDPTGRRPGRTE